MRKGVAKLGYAWEAAHVRCYRGQEQLTIALKEIGAQPADTGAHVIVQDFARNDVRSALCDSNARLEVARLAVGHRKLFP